MRQSTFAVLFLVLIVGFGGPGLAQNEMTTSTPDEIAWTAVDKSSDPAQLESFLKLYPQSPHRGEAEARLAALKPPAVEPLPTKSPQSGDAPTKSLPDAPASAVAANGRAAIDLLKGNTIHGRGAGSAGTEFYVSFINDGVARTFSLGKFGMGTWKVDDNKLCLNVPENPPVCGQVSITGEEVLYDIGEKAPINAKLIHGTAFTASPLVPADFPNHLTQAICDTMLHTKMPYQLMTRISGDQVPSAGPTQFVQVYRHENLLTTRYLEAERGAIKGIIRIDMQANYLLASKFTSDDIKSETSVKWSVPTDKYFYEAGLSEATQTQVVNGAAKPPSQVTFKMIGDDRVSFGACIVPVKHFEMQMKSTTSIQLIESWYSPDLETSLKYSLSSEMSSAEGKKINVLYEVADITDSFVPIKH